MQSSLLGRQVTLKTATNNPIIGQPPIGGTNDPQTGEIVNVYVGRAENVRYTILMSDGSLLEKIANEFTVNQTKAAKKADKKAAKKTSGR